MLVRRTVGRCSVDLCTGVCAMPGKALPWCKARFLRGLRGVVGKSRNWCAQMTVRAAVPTTEADWVMMFDAEITSTEASTST